MQRLRAFRGGFYARLFTIETALSRSHASYGPRLRGLRLDAKTVLRDPKVAPGEGQQESRVVTWSVRFVLLSFVLGTGMKVVEFATYIPPHPAPRGSLQHEYLPPDDLIHEFFPLPALEGLERCRKHRKENCVEECCNLSEQHQACRDERKMLEYDYLPDGYIRLIKIKPGPLETEMQLELYPIRFITPEFLVKSASIPTYTALSYTWKDHRPEAWWPVWMIRAARWLSSLIQQKTDVPNCDVLVDCGGVVKPLGRNIHSLLCECRRRGELGPFWFDALSIDQQDEEEKARQITIMHKIYKHSDRLIVWLGGDDGSVNINAAIGILNAFKANKRQPLTNARSKPAEAGTWQYIWKAFGWRSKEDVPPMYQEIRMDRRTNEELRDIFQLTREHDAGWSAIKNLLQRPYFQRAWIIQEVIVAGEGERLIWVGKHDVSDLFSVVSVLADYPEIEGLLYEAVLTSPEILPRLGKLWRARMDYPTSARSWWLGSSSYHWHGFSLDMLLAEYRGKQCQEPVDQVRSLRGLESFLIAPPIALPHLYLRKWLAPQPCMRDGAEGVLGQIQHEKAKRAFFEAARDIISTDRGLGILAHHNLYLPNHAPDWPSWLPDWSAARPELYSPCRTVTNQNTFPSNMKNFRFEDEILFINAHVLGKVGRQHRDLTLRNAMTAAAELEAREIKLFDRPPVSEREALRRFQVDTLPRFLPGPVYESAVGELQGPSNMQEGDIIVVAGKCAEPLLLRAHEGSQDVYRVIGTCFIPALRMSRKADEFWKGIQWKIEEMEIR